MLIPEVLFAFGFCGSAHKSIFVVGVAVYTNFNSSLTNAHQNPVNTEEWHVVAVSFMWIWPQSSMPPVSWSSWRWLLFWQKNTNWGMLPHNYYVKEVSSRSSLKGLFYLGFLQRAKHAYKKHTLYNIEERGYITRPLAYFSWMDSFFSTQSHSFAQEWVPFLNELCLFPFLSMF